MAADFPLPELGERLLFVAPHPDDEALAAGGLLHASLRRGAEVSVAFLTSGDGFALGGAAHFRRWPSPSVMRRFGAVRETEAALAAERLGLPPEHLHFLRFPDRGLATLWLRNWEKPYPSRYTGRSNADPGHPYTGRALLDHLENLIAAEAPDVLLYPDPADDHPDHWAGACFTRMALERLARRGQPVPATARTYLTHRGLWPDPLEERPHDPLEPPPALARLPVEWAQVPLPAEALQAKRGALAAYRSQTRLVANFFRGFVRGSELFARWPEPVLSPENPALHLADPVRDRWGRAHCAAADVAALELKWGETTVEVRVRLRKPALPGLTYRLHWTSVDAREEAAAPRTLALQGGLLASLPLTSRPSVLMLGAEVWCGPLLLDRTPWRTIPLAHGTDGQEK